MQEYSTILNASQVIKQFVVQPENDFDLNFKTRWTSPDHYERLAKQYRIINLIGTSLAFLERDASTLADIPFVMNNLMDRCEVLVESLNLPEDQRDQFINLIDQHFSTMVTPASLLANILDPGYRGKGLSENQLLAGLRFSDEYFQRNNLSDQQKNLIRSNFLLYQSEQGVFSQVLHRKTKEISAVVWWSSFKNYTILGLQETVRFAVRILSVKPTTAKIEQILSKQKLTHSDLRNRLGDRKVEMLVTIDIFNSQQLPNTRRKRFIFEEASEELDHMTSDDFSIFESIFSDVIGDF